LSKISNNSKKIKKEQKPLKFMVKPTWISTAPTDDDTVSESIGTPKSQIAESPVPVRVVGKRGRKSQDFEAYCLNAQKRIKEI